MRLFGFMWVVRFVIYFVILLIIFGLFVKIGVYVCDGNEDVEL